MASFEDYDEFGNYIGADIDSEEEADVSQEDITAPHAQQQQPLEGYDDEPIGAGPGTALMEVDGGVLILPKTRLTLKVVVQSPHTTPSSCMKISNIILQLRRYTAKASRPWYRKRMRNPSRNPSSRQSRCENGR